MIFYGDRRGGALQLGQYLLCPDANELVAVRDLACYPVQDMSGASFSHALRLMDLQAKAHGQRRTLFHTTMAPAPGEWLTTQQRRKAIQVLARHLRLEGHQFVCVEHIKNKKQHFHLVFNMIDPRTGNLAIMGWTHFMQMRAAREIETAFGLKPVIKKQRVISVWERERARRRDLDLRQMRAKVTELYEESATGAAFVAKLLRAHYILSKGRYGRYVLIDRFGDVHGLMKRLTGPTLKQVRAKFADLAEIVLPVLAEVQTYLRAKIKPQASSLSKASFAAIMALSVRADRPKRLAPNPGPR